MAASRAQRLHSDASEEEMTVLLKLVKTVACKVKPTETVGNLKALLYEKGIVSENIQNIFFAGQLLNDGERLVDRGIQRYSSLDLFLQNFDGMKLFVTIPSAQKTIVVGARADDTVQSVKSLIQLTEGIESDRFSLVYKGNLLEEKRTLSSLNVENESTLYLAFCQNKLTSVYVKALNGEVVKLKVKETFTVSEVKAIAASMLPAFASAGGLFYLGQHLEDAKILGFYDIKEESMLEMLHPVFQIFVKTWSGKTLIVDVQQNTTVENLKNKLFQKVKVPVHLQSIIYAGKRLEGGRDLASYSIQKNCTVYMVFAPSSTIKHVKVSDIFSSISHLTTVRSVKEGIQSQLGIQVKEVVFNKVALRDASALESYGINLGTTLSIVY